MQGGDTSERRVFSLVRSEDMLVLDLELRNLRLDAKSNKLRVADEHERAWLIVSFPPQHLAEKPIPAGTKPADIGIPVETRLSGPSRLAFRLRSNVKEVDFDPRALLAWGEHSDFEISVVPDTRRDEEIRSDALPDTCSAIEMPLRLFLSSDSASLWQALPGPVQLESPDVHAGAKQVVTSELWHARLVPSESSPARRGRAASVRAVWSPYYDEKATDRPFEWLPRGFYRDAILRTHRAELDPSPLLARHFLLSSLGAWLDLDGPEFPGAPSVALERWSQRTAFGQDEIVVTESKGYLLPTGHAASLVTVRRRRLSAHASPGATADSPRAALIFEHRYVKVAGAEADYDADRSLPFRRVRLIDLVTPPLTAEPAPQRPFWIDAGAPAAHFRFAAECDDWSGGQQTFTVAAMFVPVDAPAQEVQKACTTYAASGVHRTSDFAGQLVDVAPARTHKEAAESSDSVDRRIELLELQWNAVPVAPKTKGAVPFATRLEALEVRLPALHGIVADDENHGWFTLRDVDEENNAGAVFLQSKNGAPRIYADFTHAGFGNLVVPSLQAAGVSQTHGIVGDVAPLAGGAFDPAAYFAGPVDEAVVLGEIPLREVLPKGAVELGSLPKLHWGRQNDGEEGTSNALAIAWQIGALEPDTRKRFLPKDNCALELEVQFARKGAEQGPPSTRAALSNYVRNYAFMSGHSLQLSYGTTIYAAGPGRPPRFEPGLVGVGVDGLLLELAQALIQAGVSFSKKSESGREFSFGVEFKNDHIDVVGKFQKTRDKRKPDPPSAPADPKEADEPDADIGDAVPWGATLLLRNIEVEVKVSIFPPFLSTTPKPTEIGIAFASPTRPFFVSSRTGIWGGGGSLAFVMAGAHPKSFTFSLAFGAFQSFRVGPAKGDMLATVGFAITVEFAGGEKDRAELKFAMIVTVAASAKLWDWLKLSLSFLLELWPTREGSAIVFLGSAKIAVKAKAAIFSVSFSLKFDMRLAGPAATHGAPTLGASATALLTDVMSADDWRTYRAAFAAEDAE